MTPWVRRIIVANVVVFLVTTVLPGLRIELGLIPQLVLTRPWTLVTSMFVHAEGLMHILFNMIGLYFFGPRLEMRMGSRHFLALYMGSGLAGGLLSLATYPIAPFGVMIGASGAVFGVLAGFARYWPREKVLVFAIIPMETWTFVILIVVASLYFGISGQMGGIGHFAHLGGAVFGYAYVRFADWHRGSARREFQRRIDPDRGRKISADEARARWGSIRLDEIHELNRDEVRRLLGKMETEGARSLSEDERRFLDRIAGR